MQDRKLAKAQKKFADEAERQKARIAAETEKLLQDSLKADGLAMEARAAAERAAFRLKESIERAKEVTEVERNLQEEIKADEAAGKEADARQRR
eukprot:6255553-Heterocapsa_arctica.AAC.1